MLTQDYYHRLYAGVLGKIIGVYLGRPFEGWVKEEIVARFGEINRFVHQQLDHPLIVSDDDITGTFMFTHALDEHGYRADFSAKHIGQSWLDNLIEGKTVLWWGGYGQSTEHTAWLNLKNGIEAPASGSIEVNGKTVAEQIGAQIFIDGWALINPGMPDKAVALAREAGRVSHDGEAVHAACLLAAMEAQAFVERDLDKLLDLGLSYVPAESEIARVVNDVRSWHRENPTDWYWAYEQLKAHYGYDRYDGTCHVMPNHGLIILSLLYAGDSFHESMKIVNTLGWDTDCNAANVGCLNGIRLGLAALDDGYDWRGPIADRILLPTANSQDHIWDAVQETDKLLAIASRLHLGETPARQPRFHFSLPGSVQGFALNTGPDFAPNARLCNDAAQQALAVDYQALVAGVPLRFATATHTPRDCRVNESSYHILGSPSLHPGQQVTADTGLSGDASEPVSVRLVIETYATQLESELLYSDSLLLAPGERKALNWTVPALGNRMIASVGLEVQNPQPGAQRGTVYLHQLDWHGTPTLRVGVDKTPVNDIWGSSWINTMDTCIKFDNQAIYRLVNNDASAPGVYVYGSNDCTDYALSIALTPQIKQPFGPIVRYQGLNRYYRFQLTVDDRLQLVREHYRSGSEAPTVIAETGFSWQPHQRYEFEVRATGDRFVCLINGSPVLEARDEAMPAAMACGAAGFYNQLGPVHFTDMAISAIS